jgi:hypothetical protein
MRKLAVAALVALALVKAAPAFAFRVPDPYAPLPTPHQQEVRYADSLREPYAMSYSDEAAQRLGLADGRWEAFHAESGNSAGPSLRGGLDTHGAVLRLQW